ncbi:hypothetical protein GQ600_24449 [Phytophthora cactorum]|nr:hypothetical protein GQ600_24449 [Phytophthora cactorum]
MARRRTAIDPIFEFDAPKTFTDLSAPLSPKPSAELAKELADAVRKLKEKEQQVKDAFKPKSNSGRHRWSLNKENQQPADWREIVAARNKQLQQKKRGKFTSLKEMRATQEPFKLHKTRSRPRQKRAPPEKEMKDLQELLKKHNKKFKATHTYEPPQHSVRQVKQWERETGKSYYALSAAERVQANQEIAVWKQKKQEERSR